MVYEVFARKWRPQVFEDVIGQEHITQTLINAIKTEHVAHAYLFSGARGVGKTSVARILAKALNCKEGEPGIPCNRCPSCLEITNGSSIDVQEIDGASNRGIDEIRNLRDNIKFMPSGGRFRVYIIDEVHMLTLPAFNALLKTLEEPPAHVKFIFATTEPHKVPITILSRCQRFDFKRISMVHMLDLLKKITSQEGVEISSKGLMLLARESEGSMRDAESLLDQVIAYAGAKVEEKAITDILGIIDRTVLSDMSKAIIENQPAQCLEIIEQVYNYGYDLKEFYRSLMDQFRNLLVSLIVPGGALLDMIEAERLELKKLAETAGEERLLHSVNLLIAKENNLRLSGHPRLVLETIILKLCHLGQILSLDELLRKLAELEKRLPAGESPVRTTRGQEPEKGPLPGSIPSEDWDGLLKYLSAKNKAVANVLMTGWHCMHASGDTLELTSNGDAFSTRYFDEADNLAKLESLAADYFKRAVKIKIRPGTVRKEQGQPAAEQGKIKKNGPDKNGYAQPVKDILDLFQGEVKQGNGAQKEKSVKSQT